MKAIVANVLLGGIFGCLSLANSACANPKISHPPHLSVPNPLIISATLIPQATLPITPKIKDFVEGIFAIKKPDTLNTLDWTVDDAQVIFNNGFDSNLNLPDNQSFLLDKKFYTHRQEQSNLILGFQNTFWPSDNKNKYWGLTTIEHWGTGNKKKLNLPKLNYTDSAPTLSAGSSALTVSGGGNKNLAKKADSSREFQEFRGGVTYHHGVVQDITMGVGFVYEDFLVGFTQLTYDSHLLPVRTTISFLAKESGLDIHSHVRIKPAPNIVLNYYNNQEKQEFDANWDLISGLTLTAKGNSKNESLSTGIKVAVDNEDLSLSAKAALNNNNQLEWKFKSQIDQFKFVHSNNNRESKSEFSVNLLNPRIAGFQCSAFIKYQTRERKREQEDFTTWGGKLHSARKVAKNKHLWTLELGYGSGSSGKGLIANSSVALKPNLSLKLTYQEISAVSDDTKIKLEIGSK